jgi:anaerobic magnesium-protoporphyrin IX monomethyl ester cyclase
MLRGTGLRLRAEDHQYIYSDSTPYEILGNSVLSFDDIIAIKQVEDVLEKYWNDHRMDHTVEFLVAEVFPTPFDFFQEFGTYWEEKGWSKIGHQLEDLFKRLNEFLHDRKTTNLSIINDLMKYDYLSNQRYKPRKPWWEPTLSKSVRSGYYQSILANPSLIPGLNLDEKDLYKHTLIEPLSFDLEQYLNENKIEERPTLLFIYYNPKSEKQSFRFIKDITSAIH